MSEQQTEQAILNAVYDASTQSLKTGGGTATLETPNGDSVMDDTLNAVQVTSVTKLEGIIDGTENDNILVMPGRRIDAFEATLLTADATTAVSVKALTASKSHYITDIVISTDTAGWIRIEDTDATTIMPRKYFPANSIWSKSYVTPKKVTTAKAILVLAQNAGNISVDINGYTI